MADFSISTALPECNVIPFPTRGRDQAHEFKLRYHAVMLLRSRYDLTHARCAAAYDLEGEEAYAAAKAEYWHVYELMVEAVGHLADFPAWTKRQLQLKRRAIGRIWLTAAGEPYERYRAAIAADEARLSLPRKQRAEGNEPREIPQPFKIGHLVEPN